MTTIAELGAFLARESAVASPPSPQPVPSTERAPLRMAAAVAMPDPDRAALRRPSHDNGID